MNRRDQIECLMIDSLGVNNHAVIAGLKWLINHGGGCVITIDKRTMKSAFSEISDERFEKIEAMLATCGITLSWRITGPSFSSKSILALYMNNEIDIVLQQGSVKRVFFVPWMESEAIWFKDAYRPAIVEVDGDENLVPSADQPQYVGMDGLIPEEQDMILKNLALMAEAYGNNLHWKELERFKADLMEFNTAWKQVDPKDVFRRCADLGMSAEDSSKVSDMVKQLREGHKFRPQRGFKNGWRH